MKVLFVCLGNICRSPMAEGLFLKHLQDMGVSDRIEVDSCGTGDWHRGETADPRMLKTASNNGITLTHKARQLCAEDLDQFDYLLVMDRQNLKDVTTLYPAYAHKILLITDLSPEHNDQIIPDPYFGDIRGFEDVYHLLDKVTYQVAHHIVQKHL